MKTGPRYKIAKRLGASVFEKAQTQKFAIAEGRVQKKRGRRAPSEYSRQMIEKQKVRITYGLPERQFARYVKEVMEKRGANPAELLHRMLELRLDNVVWRLGLTPTRRGARQMVAHGHVLVNGKKVRVPSHQISVGDRIAIREGSRIHKGLEGFADRFAERPLASWLSWNPKEMAGGVSEVPTLTSADPAGDLGSVLSFYSR